MVASLERTRLAEAVAKIAVAIADGDCVPTLEELEALAHICFAHDLHAEAARIRRWMGRPFSEPGGHAHAGSS